MTRLGPPFLAVLIAAILVAAAPGQGPVSDGARPQTQNELDRAEALKLFGLGVLHERGHRLVEATRCFERAARLDPQATPVLRALVPLYLALDRSDDALAVCRRALDLDPDDHETWHVYARQLKAAGRDADAVDALKQGVRCPGLKDRPDRRLQMYHDLGVLLEAAQDFAGAEAAFREVAQALDNPAPLLEAGAYSRDEIVEQAAEVHERVGRVCLRGGSHDRAVAAFEEAGRKDPRRAARLAFNLAQVFADRGDWPKALARVNEYLATQPQGTEGYELMAEALRRLGRDEAGVLAELRRHEQGNRQNKAFKALLARQYVRAGRPQEAEALFLEVASESPSPEVYRGLFELYRQTGGASRVLQALDAALTPPEDRDGGDGPRVNPSADKARSMLVVLRDDAGLVRALLEESRGRLTQGAGLGFQTRFFLAVLAARTKQLDHAEALYRSCLDHAGGVPRQSEHNVYGGLLQVLNQAHKYEAVVAVCRKGLAQAEATNRVLFHLQMSQALVRLGKADEAVAEANRAVAVAGDNERLPSRLNRVSVLTYAERPEQASAEGRSLLKEYTKPADVHDIRHRLTSAYIQARNYPAAEEQLHQLLRDDPDDATANNDLGYIWADQNKNLDEAERMVRKAIELDRRDKRAGKGVVPDADLDSAAYVDSLGWVLFRKGRLPDARRELEKAAALPGGDDDPVVWDHLGDVYARLAEPARAAAAWKKAAALYEVGRRPNTDGRHQDVLQKLKLLEKQP